eukprot:jgi/Mesen1/2174/ME000152S01251
MPAYTKAIECTAYCSCGYCCKWEWGIGLPGKYYLALSPSLLFLQLKKRKLSKGRGVVPSQLPLLAKYWTDTTLLGDHYQGLTANGRYPGQSRPGLFSALSLRRPEKIPGRLLLFPWRLLARPGTIAADTRFYPFGTKMYIPGYGWGVVEDRGSAIKGPTRVDLYHHSHHNALQWGRRTTKVLVILPGQSTVDLMQVPAPVKAICKGAVWLKRLFF